MCNFFSFVTDEFGKKYYYTWEERKLILPDNEGRADSHSGICKKFGLNEDKINKYEFNPLTGKFYVDQINSPADDRAKAEAWVRKLDFKKIVPLLAVKTIVNPLLLNGMEEAKEETPIYHLKKWDSVRASVWDSVGASVGASVRASVGASVRARVWDSVGASVGASVRASVRASVGASVGASVWDSVKASVRASVWDSVWASVWAYTSSFIHTKYKYDFSSVIKLWEAGFVPSFDGTVWRLHSGKDANIVLTWNPKTNEVKEN